MRDTIQFFLNLLWIHLLLDGAAISHQEEPSRKKILGL